MTADGDECLKAIRYSEFSVVGIELLFVWLRYVGQGHVSSVRSQYSRLSEQRGSAGIFSNEENIEMVIIGEFQTRH